VVERAVQHTWRLRQPAVEQALILTTPCREQSERSQLQTSSSITTAETYLQRTFWQQAMTGNDQLRQRVKFALTEMMVVSSTNPAVGRMPRGMANYYDVLGADAFGNFRKLLEDVTLSPVMGKFLSMLGNDKGDANRDDENCAREVMQFHSRALSAESGWDTEAGRVRQRNPTYPTNDVLVWRRSYGLQLNIPGDPENTSAWSNCCAHVGNGFGEVLADAELPQSHSRRKEFSRRHDSGGVS
jgi:uncharacterized protein (DUF1800 family)